MGDRTGYVFTVLCILVLASFSGAEDQIYQIDLPTALRLAKADSSRIKLARERLNEAEARLAKSQLSLLPDLSFGASLYRHDGPLQETSGNLVDVNRNASQIGLGTGASGAGRATIPGLSVQTDLADTFYDPLVAKQSLAAARADLLEQRLGILQSVADLYFELLRAKGYFATAQESLNHANDLYEITSSFVASGEGLESDSIRVQVEQMAYRRNMERARETAHISSIKLASLLRLDPTILLQPSSTRMVKVDFVDGEKSVKDSILTALSCHPSLDRECALVKMAKTQLSKSQNAMLIPSIALSSNLGSFKGGRGDDFNHAGTRSDVQGIIYWQLQNLGFGDQVNTKLQQSALQQQMISQLETMDKVAEEVAIAHARVSSRRRQVEIGEKAIAFGKKAYQLNRTRIFEKQSLPIEALQAIGALNAAQQLYIDSVIDHNQAQYALFTAMGQPCGDLSDVSCVISQVEEKIEPGPKPLSHIVALPVETPAEKPYAEATPRASLLSKILKPKSN